MDLDNIRRICPLTVDEVKEIENNFEEYRETIEELESEYSNYVENLRDKTFIQGKIASINYSSYEEYMKIHANVIKISALLSDLQMMGRLEKEKVDRKIKNLLNKYLILKGFH